MSILDNIDEFLPKYLSEPSEYELKEQLSRFSSRGTENTIYTTALSHSDELFQGDGLSQIPFYDAVSQEVRPANVIVLSNSCDINLNNKRMESINICVAPILNLEKYEKRLLTKGYNKQQVASHISDIKRQVITHVIYLPKTEKMTYEAIVRLDKICSVDRNKVSNEDIQHNRLFTLSDFGLYLFLLKLSIHFTRIKERIDRYKGEILPPITPL